MLKVEAFISTNDVYILRIICPDVLYKTDVFNDFAKFTGDLCTGITFSIRL